MTKKLIEKYKHGSNLYPDWGDTKFNYELLKEEAEKVNTKPTQQEAENNSILKLIFGIDY